MTMRYHTRRDQGAIIGPMEHETYTEAQRNKLHPTFDDAGQRIIVNNGRPAPRVEIWNGTNWVIEFVPPVT